MNPSEQDRTKLDFAGYILKHRELIDRYLDECLSSEQIPERNLTDAMRYSVFAGGKRLRPIPQPKMSRAPITRRHPSGSPRQITPKQATSGTSAVIITLTLSAGICDSAWLMESWAPTENSATAATVAQAVAVSGKSGGSCKSAGPRQATVPVKQR